MPAPLPSRRVGRHALGHPNGVPLLGATAYRNLWLNLGHGALGVHPGVRQRAIAQRVDRRASTFHRPAGVQSPGRLNSHF